LGGGKPGGSGRFVLSTQATRAEVQALVLATHENPGRMDVGFRTAVGMALGMADVRTELQRLAANIALQFNRLLECFAKLLLYFPIHSIIVRLDWQEAKLETRQKLPNLARTVIP
jgi:hypothetical protein